MLNAHKPCTSSPNPKSSQGASSHGVSLEEGKVGAYTLSSFGDLSQDRSFGLLATTCRRAGCTNHPSSALCWSSDQAYGVPRGDSQETFPARVKGACQHGVKPT
jgi:hypothetical protein